MLEGDVVAIGQCGVGERPEVLGGLQLRCVGGVGGQKQQVDVFRHAQLGAGIPTGAVRHEHDLSRGTRADGCGEGGEFGYEEFEADGGGEVKDRAPRGGMDEAHQIAPREAMLGQADGVMLCWVKGENLPQANLVLPAISQIIFVDSAFFAAEVEVTESYLMRIVANG